MALLIFLLCGFTVYGNHTKEIYASQVYDLRALGKPKQKYKWSVNPTLRVCEDSGVPMYRAARAVKYWEHLGYEFDGVFRGSFSTCMNPKFGEIVITIPEAGFSSDHMAATRLYTHKKTGEIVKAKIFILPKNARKDRVLEHELGHALGWSHYSQRYHMMHPQWKYGGYDSYGIRKVN